MVYSDDRLTAESVQYILTNYDELAELRFLSADSFAADVIMSIDSAVAQAELTDIERLLLELRFKQHLKLGAISEIVDKPTYKVSRSIKKICRKIAEV